MTSAAEPEVPPTIDELLGRVVPGPAGLGADALAAVATCMATSRSIRRFRPDPVDPDVVELVLRLATTAGSGANIQPWRFVVVTAEAERRALGDWYRLAWEEYGVRGMRTLPADASAPRRRSIASAEHLAEHFEDAPVLVVPCLRASRRMPVNLFIGGSVYPAVQNLILAARAVGLGTTLTCMQGLSDIGPAGEALSHPQFLDGLREILAIPADAVPVAVLPLGWPDEHFGVTDRRPVHEVAYRDRWGAAW